MNIRDLHRPVVAEDLRPGQEWAYRLDREYPVEHTVIESVIPRPKVPHLMLRFDNGKIRDVSMTKLAFPWTTELLAVESRWRAMKYAAQPAEGNSRAAEHVLARYVGENVAAVVSGPAHAYLRVHDVAELCRISGVDASVLTSAPAAFVEDSVLHTSWPALKRVAFTLARQHTEDLARCNVDEAISLEEMEARFGWDRKWARVIEDRTAALRVLETWVGPQPVSPAVENAVLRRQLADALRLADNALDLLLQTHAANEATATAVKRTLDEFNARRAAIGTE